MRLFYLFCITDIFLIIQFLNMQPCASVDAALCVGRCSLVRWLMQPCALVDAALCIFGALMMPG